jgi:hypothetical protein
MNEKKEIEIIYGVKLNRDLDFIDKFIDTRFDTKVIRKSITDHRQQKQKFIAFIFTLDEKRKKMDLLVFSEDEMCVFLVPEDVNFESFITECSIFNADEQNNLVNKLAEIQKLTNENSKTLPTAS